MPIRWLNLVAVLFLVASLDCGKGGAPSGGAGATQRTGTAGSSGSGGANGTGGTTSSGGVSGGGGSSAGTGGAPNSGGVPGSGGASGGGMTGGAGMVGSGGFPGSGGATGGSGMTGVGGMTGTGSMAGNGGSPGTGGATGGGASGTGGGSAGRASGGASSGGGSRAGGASGGGGSRAGGASGGGGGSAGGGSGGAGASDGGAPTDVAPAAYSPCPTDGSNCVILPLGDSITLGFSDDGMQDKIGGYRGQLFHDALADHKKITFVGPCSNGPATIDGTSFPAKHAGFFAQNINSIANLMTGGSGGSMYCPSGSLFAFNVIPHIVLLHAGTNNRNDSSTQMTQDAADLGSLIDKVIGKAPNASIFVAQLIPVGDNGPEDAFVVKFNDLIATTVVPPRQNAGKHVYIVDQHTSFDPKTMFPAKADPIHPNQAGYNHM